MDQFKDNLTEVEIAKIEAFCADENMFEAVHKAVLAMVYYTGALRRGEKFVPQNQAFDLIHAAYKEGRDITNENLGAGLRGLFEGVDCVEQGFSRLKNIKAGNKSTPSPYNEAI